MLSCNLSGLYYSTARHFKIIALFQSAERFLRGVFSWLHMWHLDHFQYLMRIIKPLGLRLFIKSHKNMLLDIFPHAHKPSECKFTLKRKDLKADIITGNISINLHYWEKAYKASYELIPLATLHTLSCFKFKPLKLSMCDLSAYFIPEECNHLLIYSYSHQGVFCFSYFLFIFLSVRVSKPLKKAFFISYVMTHLTLKDDKLWNVLRQFSVF